jgi:predicted DNA-binding protein (UPF0251 family)
MLGQPEHRQQWQQRLADLAGKAIELTPTIEAGQQLQEFLTQSTRSWQETFASLDYGEEHDRAIRLLNQEIAAGLHETSLTPAEAFGDIIDQATGMYSRIRDAFARENSQTPETALAIHLGEAVDQALYPPDVEFHLYEREKNPDWQIDAPRHSVMRNLTDPLAIPHTPMRGAAPPPQFVWVGHSREPGELAPPFAWREKVEALWTRSGIAQKFPDGLPRVAGGARHNQMAQKDFESLKSAIEEMVIICRNGLFSIAGDENTGRLNTQKPGGTNPKRKRPRRQGSRKTRPLTEKELESMHLVGELKGNITAAAEQVGITRQAMSKRYRKACAKLGQSAMPEAKNKGLPTDKRGQEHISDAEDRRKM